MTADNILSDQSQHQLLSTLCAEAHSGQLVYHPKNSPPVSSKVRLLDLSGGYLRIERPRFGDQNLCLREGDEASVFFSWEGGRFVFKTRVRNPADDAGDGTEAPEQIPLEAPAFLERAQQRECYRVGVAHLATSRVDCQPPPQPEERLEGLMVNLSETGCGMTVDRGTFPDIRERDSLQVNFLLPNEPDSFALVGQVRWIEDMLGRKRIRFGLAWELESISEDPRLVQARLGKFIVAEQYRAVKRKK